MKVQILRNYFSKVLKEIYLKEFKLKKYDILNLPTMNLWVLLPHVDRTEKNFKRSKYLFFSI